MYLDEKLNFLQDIQEKTSEAYRGFGVIWKIRHILPTHALITIYKSFVRPYLNYCHIVYHQPNNKTFCNKIEKIQYNAVLKITSAVRIT